MSFKYYIFDVPDIPVSDTEIRSNGGLQVFQKRQNLNGDVHCEYDYIMDYEELKSLCHQNGWTLPIGNPCRIPRDLTLYRRSKRRDKEN